MGLFLKKNVKETLHVRCFHTYEYTYTEDNNMYVIPAVQSLMFLILFIALVGEVSLGEMCPKCHFNSLRNLMNTQSGRSLFGVGQA
ncbi:unnamed protein product [Phytomonas sp. Hart1]|nr:unnamed protein product [Phytomonas sp. Hart1]|eukprot:CCW71831.1 unnamed protein product [Phytomonas sp. isolate Hart1]